jgi:polysaccharide chain length determinant protein (PEP-CTERM system associated)
MSTIKTQIYSEVRSALRYRWTALLVASISFIAATLLLYATPEKFESRAQIYVDTKSILRPLLEGLAVSPDTDAQADVVRRALLARPTLTRVAEKSGLMLRAPTPTEQEELIQEMQKKIEVLGDARTSIYTISFVDPVPRTAQSVVQSLLDYFVADSLGQDRSDAERAEKFLSQQVTEYEARLTEAEGRLAAFKQQNVGLMPSESGDSIVRLQRENEAIENLQTGLAIGLRQRDELRAKLGGTASGRAPSPAEVETATQLDSQIADSRRQLNEMMLKYTEKHPQVAALRETIDRLEERRKTEVGNVRETGSGAGRDPLGGGRGNVVQSLQIALDDADVRVATLQTQLVEAQRRVGALKRLVSVSPEVEAELARLNRDYGVTRSRYEALLQRLESARISDKADRTNEIKFRVIDPPRIPLRPAGISRPMLIVFGFLASLLLGGAIAVALARINPVFFDRRDLEAYAGIPVAGVISRLQAPDEISHARVDRVKFALAAVALFAMCIGVALSHRPGSVALRSFLGMQSL